MSVIFLHPDGDIAGRTTMSGSEIRKMLPFVSAEMAPKGKWQDNIWRMPLGKMYERPYFTRKGHRRRLRKEKKNDIR